MLLGTEMEQAWSSEVNGFESGFKFDFWHSVAKEELTVGRLSSDFDFI